MSALLEEMRAFVGFDADVEAQLRALEPVLAPRFEAIADRFDAATSRNPAVAEILGDASQRQRHRRVLVEWMAAGLREPHSEALLARHVRIAERHVAVGLLHHHIFAAMSVLRLAFHDELHALLPDAEAYVASRAIDRLFDLELEIMSRHYQRETQEQVRARERRVQAERVRSVQTLSAGLAHEVRNPLNSAKLQLQVLERRLRRSGLDATLVEPSELAAKEIARLTALLDDFLEFARPSQLQLRAHDLAVLVRDLLEGERASAERQGVHLQALGDATLVADVDAARFQQIVLNLVRNAVDATPAGGSVRVTLAAAGIDQVTLSVEDDGPGIPDEVRARMYEPFFSTKEGGTGLGMSIVHALVTLHAGTIALDTSSVGTRFTVALPRRAAA